MIYIGIEKYLIYVKIKVFFLIFKKLKVMVIILLKYN